MTTEAISPLRQRMLANMNSRKLCAHTQRGHIYSCKRLAAFLKRSPDTATAEDLRLFQLHLAETGISICNRNRIMTGVRFLFRVTLRRLDLAAEIYHIREPQKIPLVMSPDETRRLLAVVDNLKVRTWSRLWLRPARRRGGQAEGQAHRQSAEDHSGRAVQGPQGPQCHAVAGDVRPAAPMVEGAPIASRSHNAATGTLAVSRPQGRQADDHPPVKPPVPRGRRRSRDQEEGDAARTAPQLRDPLARARHRYQNHPGAARS